MKLVDGIDMEKVKAAEVKEMITAFNKAKLGTQIKAGANPLGSAKAFVKAVEALDESKLGDLPQEVQDYYNLIVVSDDELDKQPEEEEAPAPPEEEVVQRPDPIKKKPAAKVEKKPVVKAEKKLKGPEMPEQNGIRRPRPEGKCGQAWAIFDSLSKRKKGAIPAIADCLKIAEEKGLNPGNVRAEYPRWKKFNQ